MNVRSARGISRKGLKEICKTAEQNMEKDNADATTLDLSRVQFPIVE